MSFHNNNEVQGTTKVITNQPTSSDTGLENIQNAGGWIPAIERAILKLSQNADNNQGTSAPSAPPDTVDRPSDAPPSYSALYPETDTSFDSSISRSFQTNNWRNLYINGKQIFSDLNELQYMSLDEAVNTPDATIYSVKITRELADDQKCLDFETFLKMFTFVKNYLKFKSEKEMKTVLPENEIRQTNRYDPALMTQVETAPPQTRHPDPMGDPFCCWMWFIPSSPTTGETCPCFCCCPCFNCCMEGAEAVDDVGIASNTECCGDCGDCDCGGCDCGGCDCGF